MNEIIQHLKNHRSIREFDPTKEVTEEQIETIVSAALAQPNWINGQQVSIIEVRDPDRKAQFARASGNQKHVFDAPVFLIFCMDFYRAKLAAEKHQKQLQIVDDIEAILIGSTDVGIALGGAVVAAESMGLGTVPIGGIRRDPQIFVELLNLPEYVFPVCGLSIGYPKNIPDIKPRIPLQATLHKETYDKEIQKEMIDQYDETIVAYMKARTNGKDSTNWSTKQPVFMTMVSILIGKIPHQH